MSLGRICNPTSESPLNRSRSGDLDLYSFAMAHHESCSFRFDLFRIASRTCHKGGFAIRLLKAPLTEADLEIWIHTHPRWHITNRVHFASTCSAGQVEQMIREDLQSDFRKSP